MSKLFSYFLLLFRLVRRIKPPMLAPVDLFLPNIQFRSGKYQHRSFPESLCRRMRRRALWSGDHTSSCFPSDSHRIHRRCPGGGRIRKFQCVRTGRAFVESPVSGSVDKRREANFRTQESKRRRCLRNGGKIVLDRHDVMSSADTARSGRDEQFSVSRSLSGREKGGKTSNGRGELLDW